MNQVELFPPAIEAIALAALRFYHDDTDCGWPPETEFDALWIAYMMDAEPAGPFCFCALPSRRSHQVDEVYRALDRLAEAGQVVKRNHYFGADQPGPDYRGFGYRYSLPKMGVL